MVANERHDNEQVQDQAPVHNRLPAHLTDRERKAELKAQEGIIEKWRRDAEKAGRAFAIIRSQRLYRDMVIEGTSIRTFPQYCLLRWGVDASRIRQMIGYVRGKDILAERTDIEPENENQLRPLLKLVRKDPDKAAEVWREAAKAAEGTPTERHVREALERADIGIRISKPPAPEASREGTETPAEAPHADQVAPESVPSPIEPLEAPLKAAIESWWARSNAIIEWLTVCNWREGLTQEQRVELREKLRTLAVVNRELRALL